VSRLAFAPFALLAFACGTNRPEIPEELLKNPSMASACSTPGYPAGPYGVDAGSTAGDLCFQGWQTPNQTDHTASTLENVSLGHYFDPKGEKYEILLVNTAAVWCSVCKSEHQTLPDHYAELAPRGLAIVSALFQDNAGKPAELSDLKTWVEAYDVPFPMVLDPDYQLGSYASAETAPLNLVIDARTMQIIDRFIGNQSEDLWQLIEGKLAERAGTE
jgi:peroxiredoxin